MNEKEVTAEVERDFSKIKVSTLQRLFGEYYRERKKLNVDNTKVYPKCYTVKTAGKNTWLIFMTKSLSIAKYKHESDSVACAVVYYYSKEGLSVIRYHDEGRYLEVFYGHFFTRYNQRLQLGIHHQLDVIKKFFLESGYLEILRTQKNNRTITTGICKEGMALGEYFANINWQVHKTFITHELKRESQEKTTAKILDMVQTELSKLQTDDAVTKKVVQIRSNSILRITGTS